MDAIASVMDKVDNQQSKEELVAVLESLTETRETAANLAPRLVEVRAPAAAAL